MHANGQPAGLGTHPCAGRPLLPLVASLLQPQLLPPPTTRHSPGCGTCGRTRPPIAAPRCLRATCTRLRRTCCAATGAQTAPRWEQRSRGECWVHGGGSQLGQQRVQEVCVSGSSMWTRLPLIALPRPPCPAALPPHPLSGGGGQRRPHGVRLERAHPQPHVQAAGALGIRERVRPHGVECCLCKGLARAVCSLMAGGGGHAAQPADVHAMLTAALPSSHLPQGCVPPQGADCGQRLLRQNHLPGGAGAVRAAGLLLLCRSTAAL